MNKQLSQFYWMQLFFRYIEKCIKKVKVLSVLDGSIPIENIGKRQRRRRNRNSKAKLGDGSSYIIWKCQRESRWFWTGWAAEGYKCKRYKCMRRHVAQSVGLCSNQNEAAHVVHWKGLSPVWLRICRTINEFNAKVLSHILPLYTVLFWTATFSLKSETNYHIYIVLLLGDTYSSRQLVQSHLELAYVLLVETNPFFSNLSLFFTTMHFERTSDFGCVV